MFKSYTRKLPCTVMKKTTVNRKEDIFNDREMWCTERSTLTFQNAFFLFAVGSTQLIRLGECKLIFFFFFFFFLRRTSFTGEMSMVLQLRSRIIKICQVEISALQILKLRILIIQNYKCKTP
jgi:hypothetical protein